VTREFRDETIRIFNLSGSAMMQKHLRFISYLKFNAEPCRVDKVLLEGTSIVPYKTVKEIYGVGKRTEVSALKFLETFSREVMPLEISDYSKKENRCRSVKYAWPDEFKALCKEHLKHRYHIRANNDDMVDLETGLTWSEYREREMIRENTIDILNALVRHDHPMKQVFNALHRKPVIEFTLNTTKQAMPYLWNMQRDMPELSQKEIDRRTKIRQYEARHRYEAPHDFTKEKTIKQTCHDTLTVFEQVGMIKYRDSHNTVRLSAEGLSIMGMPKAFRKQFYSGCIELDLKSAQLAIVAKEWNLPVLTKFLKNGGDIWEELASFIGRDMTDVKGDIKVLTYAALYGMEYTHLVSLAEDTLGDSKILSHPILAEILKYRQKALALIRKEGGAINCFGEWVEKRKVQDGLQPYDWKEAQEKAERSVLASLNQATEQMLMLSVFEAIQANKNLLLVAWIHDGCIIHVKHNKEHTEAYVKRIQKKLATRAKELGIPTSLEETYL